MADTTYGAQPLALVGTELAGRYELLELLGSGGMGSVYKACQRHMESFVAVKLLHPGAAVDLSNLKRLQQEARVLASLNHPAIPKVHVVEALPSAGMFVVMDYIDGVSLSQMLAERGKLPVDETVALFLQIADALDHAHQKGIIHRDLKPSNIMISGEHAYLLDFGIAKTLDSVQKFTQTGAIVGTVRYMSPEQAQGSSVTAQSDIYSLGCVLYETLAGKPLYECDSPLETMMRHLHGTLPELTSPEVSPLAAPLAKALAKQPSDRFASMQEFAAALRAPNTVSTKAQQPRRKAGRFAQKPTLIAVAAACLAVVGAVWYVDKRDRDQATVEVEGSEFMDPSYIGAIDQSRLQAFTQDVIDQRVPLKPDLVFEELDRARRRRDNMVDSKNAMLLGQAEVEIGRAIHRSRWDVVAHSVRDEMIKTDNNDPRRAIGYLQRLIHTADSSGRGKETEALSVKYMVAGLTGRDDPAGAQKLLQEVASSDPHREPYYYSAGRFKLLSDYSNALMPNDVIAQANGFISEYGARLPYRNFVPAFYSIIGGKQYPLSKQAARDTWWRGYQVGANLLDPGMAKTDADIDYMLTETATNVGLAAISATIELAVKGRDSKEHALGMLQDMELRAHCQTDPRVQELLRELKARIDRLPAGSRGGGG